MAQLHWGRGRIGIHFFNNEEYYETLGFLAKDERYIDIYTHDNDISGAWGGQGKLELRIPINSALPRPLRDAFSQSGDNRVSVTDYVLNLRNHSFTVMRDFTGNNYTYHIYKTNLDDVIDTIEEPIYIEDFYRGYNM